MNDLAIASWRQTLSDAREQLRQHYLERPRPTEFLRQWSRQIDRHLTELWCASRLGTTATLAAVGGYGRSELFPYSDIDLLLLLPTPPDSATTARIEKLVGAFWDIGLEVGHSVRTPDECLAEAQNDITITTTLSDCRFLTGSPVLVEQLRHRLRREIDREGFVRGKVAEQRARHLKYHDTAFNLEPNLKESPGGLRDLHSIMWLAWGTGLEPDWRRLTEAGLITEREGREARSLQNYLQNLRIRLHFLAGRREDRLLFDYQPLLARQLIPKSDDHRLISERLMHDYYKTAKSVLMLNTILLEQLVHPKPTQPDDPFDASLGEPFVQCDGLLGTTPPDLLATKPDLIFDAFLKLQTHPKLRGFTPDALRAVWRGKHLINRSFRNNPVNQQRFLEILRQPLRSAEVMRRMNQYGILGRYIPAFGRIVGQMQHDLFHVYTVDEHILRVLRNLRRFAMPQFDHEFPFCSLLMREFDRPDLLYLAALFHDIAKGRGGDHSVLGRSDALQFCKRHGLAREDSKLVAWLVEHHLGMSSVAQKKDISDPTVLHQFADRVQDVRRLTALYLLTVADIRGTSPKVWNAWKGKLLEDLFRATRRFLEGTGLDPSTLIGEKRQQALRILRQYGILSSTAIGLWKTVDSSYFQRHDAPDIAWHARCLQGRIAGTRPVIRARLSPVGEGIQVLIFAPDQMGLFARLCGFFERNGQNIVEANIYTTRQGWALDTFQLLARDPSGGEHYRETLVRIEQDLGAVLAQDAPLPPPRKGRLSRQLRHFPIPTDTLLGEVEAQGIRPLTIVTGDQPGLLYRIARILLEHQINLHGARINTLGERAEDLFMISGTTLEDPAGREHLRQALLNQLEPHPPGTAQALASP